MADEPRTASAGRRAKSGKPVMLRFNRREMLRYFRGFDYLEYKYGALVSGVETIDADGDYLPRIYKSFLSYEHAKHHILYNKRDYNEIKRRIDLIYGDSGEAEDFVFLYDFALDNLIDRYLNIPSLDKLFSEHYFEYEWRQHTDLDFKKINLGFYRDHFIHQIRNCFMIMKLLDVSEEDGGSADGRDGRFYFKKIEDALKSKHNDISKYACAQVEQYRDHVKRNVDSHMEVFADESVGPTGKKTDHDEKQGNGIPKTAGDVESAGDVKIADDVRSAGDVKIAGDVESADDVKSACDVRSAGEAIADLMRGNADEFAWEYLIKGSLIVAALFHDLGYPVSFTYKRSMSISEYISLVLPGDNIGFGRLNDLLESSLLFEITKRDELERRYDALDHGALSAFVLLLQFYETGAIRELNPIKRGMIELAAVAIYDHTLKYKVSGEDPFDRKNPSFDDNPLSYTLRFVDDLQEWDRTYFEIRDNSDLMYCEKCRMPINHIWDKLELNDMFRGIQTAQNAEHLKKPEGGGGDRHKAFRDFFDGKKFGADYDFKYALDGHMGKPYICGCNASDYSLGGVGRGYDIFGGDFVGGMTGEELLHHLNLGNCENGAAFSYQKIIYTETSGEVVALYPRRERDRVRFTFYVEYDAFRSLCLLSVNQSSLEYRMKELLKINKQFVHQGDIDFVMRTYMTNNPMMLKTRILFNFLYEVGHYVNGDSVYMRNAAYFDTLWGENNGLEFGTDELTKSLAKLNACLKMAGFYVYDYSDETEVFAGFKKIGLPIGSWNVWDEDAESAFRVTEKYVRYVVPRLMGQTSFKKDGESDTEKDMTGSEHFVKNLVNTAMAYLSLMRTALKGGDEKGLRSGFTGMMGSVSDNYTYETAYETVFGDMCEQLCRQRFDAEGMDGYYARMEEDGYGDMLDYAVKVLFDKRFYNPQTMRGGEVNAGAASGEKGFDFFDIYSDLYLFKEMNRFSDDNYRRRLESYSGSGSV